MKQKKKNNFPSSLLLLLIVSALSFSCSSAPEEAETVVETKNKAAEYADFGNKYYEESQYDQALKFFNLALDYNISIDNEEGMIQSYNSIGKVLLAAGEEDRAEENFITAFTIAEKTGNNALLLESNNNLGEIYLFKGDFNKALEYFEKALVLIGEDKEKDPKTAILYHNTGTVHKRLGNYQRAVEYLEKALEINTGNNKYVGMAANYYMIASIFSKKEQYTEAVNYALLALENDKLVENSSGIAKDMLALGIISRKAGNIADAYEYYKKSFMVYETLNLITEVKKLLNYLEQTALLLELDDEAAAYKEALTKLENL